MDGADDSTVGAGSAPSLGQLYASMAGAKVYFDELPGGNNGDQLIILGSQAFHRPHDFDLVERPEDAEVILVRGNGVLTDFYAHTPHRARVQSYIDRFPKATLVIEPSTLSFATEPAFRIGPRDTEVYLYTADATSFDRERPRASTRAPRRSSAWMTTWRSTSPARSSSMGYATADPRATC